MATTLAQLKTKLQIITGTSIGEVCFDWQEYLNEQRTKVYPVVLWSLSGSRFEKDVRSATVQKVKIFTFTIFAIQSFDALTEDKITVWDTLESKVDTYFNVVNANSGLQIENINEMKGEYAGEGLISVDSEVGIIYRDVVLKVYC